VGGHFLLKARKSNCKLCGYLCGLVAYFNEDGIACKVEPDPSRYPYDATIVRRCPRFACNIEILNHPERINYPLKRVGERGSGKWQRVGWNEALDDIAARLEKLKASYGAEALATCIGGPHSIYWPLHRFLNLFGSPNNIGIGHICWNPAIWVNSLTYGWPIEPELDPGLTKCAILWGINPAASDNSLFWQTVTQFSRTGGKLIVIDPRYTRTAARASIWLPARPGSDGALALALIYVIVNEELFDRDFVSRFCTGFEALRERVKGYPPDKAAKITGISSDSIVSVARSYAKLKPAAIFSGLGIDQSGYNCTQTLRSLAILRAITGNLDEPGASHLSEMPDFVPEVELELSDILSSEQREKNLGKDRFRLQTYRGYERLSSYTQLHGKKLPTRYLTSAHPYLAMPAMLKGEPYPIRAAIVMAANPLLSQADTRMVHTALKNLDLLVVLELFMTPTATLADYVLPAAGSLERVVLQTNGGVANIAYGGPAALAPLYERRDDYLFWRELGTRLGQEKYWPWKTMEEALDDIFAPAGLTWQQFCEAGLYAPPRNYHKYEVDGFATPSGKVELCSTLLEELGYDPLPAYRHIEDEPSIYPLLLITGIRHQPYYGSGYRQIKSLRRIRPGPIAEINSETSAQFGLQEGDRVWIETPRGRIQHTLRPVKMLPGVVAVEYGWWSSEQPSAAPPPGVVWKQNSNVLTSADIEGCDAILGQWNNRALRCKVYKVPAALHLEELKL
jgi:thiosulfate reductase/polysulfide reductase chain A